MSAAHGPCNWHVYIVRCADDSLYTGITTDVERRVLEHNQSPRGAGYTRGRRPVSLVFRQAATTRSEASRLEWRIKRLTRGEKAALIDGRRTLALEPGSR